MAARNYPSVSSNGHVQHSTPLEGGPPAFTGAEIIKRMRGGSMVVLERGDRSRGEGAEVLAGWPSAIELFDEDLTEDADRILADAEALGFAVGQSVWTRWRWVREEYHHGHWEYEAVDRDLTLAFYAVEEDDAAALSFGVPA